MLKFESALSFPIKNIYPKKVNYNYLFDILDNNLNKIKLKINIKIWFFISDIITSVFFFNWPDLLFPFKHQFSR